MKRLMVFLLTSVLIVTSARAAINSADSNDCVASVLAAELREGYTTQDIVDVEIIVNDIDHGAVYQEFQTLYPEEYACYMSDEQENGERNERGETLSDDDLLQSAIEHKRMIYRTYYEGYNQNILDDYSIPDEDVIFRSSYAPLIIVSADYGTVTKMAKDDRIVQISLFHNDVAVVEDLNLANQISRADYVRDTCGMKGSGVKIGMVEASGIPNVSDSYLSGATIYIRPDDASASQVSHATKVARILVGTDNNGANDGLAPLAKLYCGVGNNEANFYKSIEWMLNSGTNVVNASMGFGGSGTYDTKAKWIDHLAINHDMHFVKSAGNDSTNTKYVTSPGMAYNAITVGGLNPNGDTDVAGFSMYNQSCYVETGTERAEKPNIIADAMDFWGDDGTSFAAPQVAGTIAQLCGYNTNLKTKQSAMGAILMASAAHKVEANVYGYVGDKFSQGNRINDMEQISNKEGAGVLDSRWAREIVVNGNFWSPTVYDAGFPYNKTVTINANSNSVVRICIFWLRQNGFSGSDHTGNPSVATMSNLDLSVYDPSGTPVGHCATTKGNFEIVQFTPQTTGTYTIRVEDTNNQHTGKDYIGIALWTGAYGN